MLASIPDFRRQAFDFIDTIDRLSDVDDVLDALQQVLVRYGFETLMFSGLPRPDQRLLESILAMRCPAGWIELYSEAQYVRVDPVIRTLKRSTMPFEWREAPYDPQREPRAHEVMRRRRDFGCRAGFVVPIHGPPASVAWVSMSGREVELNDAIKPAIHLVSVYAFERIRSLRGDGPIAKTALTPREREVLTWTAQGKHAWEISEILNIAKRTVDEHAQTAFRKLGATNRAHAVALAIRDRLIEM